ncbi:MAG: hypothetical protein Q9183_007600, partial [Haloplaca sp. 2 TL-2023]
VKQEDGESPRIKQEGSDSPRIKQEGSKSPQAKQEGSESPVDRLIQGVRVACDAELKDPSTPPPVGFTKIEQRLSEFRDQWGMSPYLPWRIHLPLAVLLPERTDEWVVNSLIAPLFNWGVAHSQDIPSLDSILPPRREATPIPDYAKVVGPVSVYRMDNKPLLPEQLAAIIGFFNKHARKPSNAPPPGSGNPSGDINTATYENAEMEARTGPLFFKMWWDEWKTWSPGWEDIPSPYEMGEVNPAPYEVDKDTPLEPLWLGIQQERGLLR